MKSFTYPKPLFQRDLPYEVQARRPSTALEKNWAMLRLLGWSATISLIAALIWYTSTDVSFSSKMIAGIVLATIGLLSGLRIGAHSATAYITDVQRLNKVLADQNKDLEKANAILLKELAADVRSPANSKSA
jgi:hypothetical protein